MAVGFMYQFPCVSLLQSLLQLLQTAYATFGGSLHRGFGSEPEISQLLLILSDGRGVFADGVQVCRLSKLFS